MARRRKGRREAGRLIYLIGLYEPIGRIPPEPVRGAIPFHGFLWYLFYARISLG